MAVGLSVVAALLLASVPSAMAAGTEATTTNATPSIVGVFFYESNASASAGATCPTAGRVTSFLPAAGATRAVHVCVEASDANGWNDVCDTGAVSAQDVRTLSAQDYLAASISTATNVKANLALACATGSGQLVALTGSFTMEYWRVWGTAAAARAYRAVPAITDLAGASASASYGSFGYGNLTSLDAASVTTVALGGALAPGASGSEAAASLYNKGNQAFTVYVSGSALTGSAKSQSIAVGSLKWAASSGVAYASKTAMSTTSASTALSAPAETSDTTTARPVYLQLTAPAGSSQWIPADTYSGTVTFATS